MRKDLLGCYPDQLLPSHQRVWHTHELASGRPNKGLYSLNGKTFYHSQSVNAERLSVKIVMLSWNGSGAWAFLVYWGVPNIYAFVDGVEIWKYLHVRRFSLAGRRANYQPTRCDWSNNHIVLIQATGVLTLQNLHYMWAGVFHYNT